MPRVRSIARLCAALVLVPASVAAACSGGQAPELAEVAPTATAPPTPTTAPTPTAVPTATAVPTETPTPVALERGVTADTVRIGIVKTGRAFGDVEVGVRARLARARRDGGVGRRRIEIAAVLDDEGDPAKTLDAVRTLVRDEKVFAIVLASAVPTPDVTDFLADRSVPFFGWGFASGFCAPNEWGFGFTGCVNGAVLGVDGALPDRSRRALVRRFLGDDPTAVLVTGRDDNGVAAIADAEDVWGDHLLESVRIGEVGSVAFRRIEQAIDTHRPDVVVLSLDLARTIALKDDLVLIFGGMVVDDVSYLPGLLGDIPTALKLEGGYAFTQIPPQEEYGDATGVLANDLEAIDGPVVYSQAISIGYWSTDLMVSLLGAVGRRLDTATFHRTALVDGHRYDPGLDGGPCPIDTRDIQRLSSGGGAIVSVTGGIYRPAVAYTCFPAGRSE